MLHCASTRPGPPREWLPRKRYADMLEAIHLTKTYRTGVRALRDLTMRVSDGELFCLLGANGAGKTTTLSCFLDFTSPSSGSAWVDGIPVAERPMDVKRRCGYVAESVAVYETLSAMEAEVVRV